MRSVPPGQRVRNVIHAQGKVAVTWSVDAEAMLTMHWTETGGPSAASPGHRGFGSMLIERQLAFELHGRSESRFSEDGLSVALHIPMDALAAPNEEITDGA